MNDKEIADRLRKYLRMDGDSAIASVADMIDSIVALVDELDPPRPKSGTVVWFPFDQSYGIASPDGRGVYNQNGEMLAWWEVESGTTPARILAPGEVAVKVPPVRGWPQWARGLSWDYQGEVRIGKVFITRAEAERMEAER